MLEFTERDRLATKCPACFGSRNEESETSLGKLPEDADFLIAIDGNFQHKRNRNATYDPLDIKPRLFLSQDFVRGVQTEVDQSNATKVVSPFISI